MTDRVSESFVPPDFVVPRELHGPGFHLEPLGPEHNQRDHEAWMSSMDHIRSTPGMEASDWPAPMTLDENMEDMKMHAKEFDERKSFTYSVLDGAEVIGCVYIYPSSDHDAHVRSWVRESRAEMDPIVRHEVRRWLNDNWPFETIDYAR